MRIDNTIAKGQLVPLKFMQDAVAASQTDTQLTLGDVAASHAVNGYVMPFEGEIVAITWNLSAAPSAGQMTIGPTVGGTEQTEPVVTVTAGTSGRQTALREKTRFAAGDVIGAEITTDGTWNATTADLVVVVWVLLHLAGI
jgi:hypothetical protein